MNINQEICSIILKKTNKYSRYGIKEEENYLDKQTQYNVLVFGEEESKKKVRNNYIQRVFAYQVKF